MHKKLIVVMGINNAGKTFYRQKFLNNYSYVDILEMQNKYPFITYDLVLKSYYETSNRLLELFENNSTVILEHTLLRAVRREEFYFSVLRNKYPDIEIEVVCITPTLSQYLCNLRNRFTDYPLSYRDIVNYVEMLKLLEKPTKEEKVEIKLLTANNCNFF